MITYRIIMLFKTILCCFDIENKSFFIRLHKHEIDFIVQLRKPGQMERELK